MKNIMKELQEIMLENTITEEEEIDVSSNESLDTPPQETLLDRDEEINEITPLKNYIEPQVRRGEIYFCNFGVTNIIDREIRKARPVIIVQNAVGNINSQNVIVVTLTSQDSRYLPTHFRIEGYGRLDGSIVSGENIRTVSKRRLGKFLGALSKTDMEEVNKILQISLGIIPLPPVSKLV